MNKYPFQEMKEQSAKALGKDLPISTKQSVEICNHIRNRQVTEARKILQDAMAEKKAIPIRRFNKDLGHKTGIGPGSYAPKASGFILKIIEEASANAQSKGLNTSKLNIVHISANRAALPWRFGRQRRIKAKRTHIAVVLEERTPVEKKKRNQTQSTPK